MISHHVDGLRSVVFADGTTIESCDYKAAAKHTNDCASTFADTPTSALSGHDSIDPLSETLVVCVSNPSRGFAPIMIDCSVDRNAQSHARGERIDCLRGGLCLRSRTTLPDSTEVRGACLSDAMHALIMCIHIPLPPSTEKSKKIPRFFENQERNLFQPDMKFGNSIG